MIDWVDWEPIGLIGLILTISFTLLRLWFVMVCY